MHIYIDCDGVLLDTEADVVKMLDENPDIEPMDFFAKLDWHDWLESHGPLGNSIQSLQSLPVDEVSILTTVGSLDEAREKVIYFRKLGVKNDIIFTPACKHLSKADVVFPKGNILIDDFKDNLRSWEQAGGIGIWFNPQKCSDEFATIHSLNELQEYLFKINSERK